MNPLNDTLSITPSGPSTVGRELPFGAVARAEATAHRPSEADAARQRIAALTEPRLDPAVAAAPALITDKQLLASQFTQTPRLALPLPKVPTKRPSIPSRLQPLAVAIGIFALTLLAFKAPVIISQLRYHNNAAEVTLPKTAAAAPISADPIIVIPKINVNAPVVYVPTVDEASVQAGLQNGVIHYGNTPMPGQGGNTVFFGHSSNDWWEPGNFKFVFVLLDKLAVGDTFSINYQSKRYTYQVTGTQVVDPTDVGVLTQTATPTATLITCSPPGTSWRRLVVSAKQIDPDPAASTTTTVPQSTVPATNLPGASPSWWQQLKNSVSSLFGHKKATSATTTTSGQTAPTTLPAAN